MCVCQFDVISEDLDACVRKVPMASRVLQLRSRVHFGGVIDITSHHIAVAPASNYTMYYFHRWYVLQTHVPAPQLYVCVYIPVPRYILGYYGSKVGGRYLGT